VPELVIVVSSVIGFGVAPTVVTLVAVRSVAKLIWRPALAGNTAWS
jgi:hypothetical protein